MTSERLEPLETLEKDYYLDERNCWYSDGEQRDSGSSDDDLREEILKLAGIRCGARKKGRYKEFSKKKDEFESDMDDELDGNFIAYASKIFSSPKKCEAKAPADKELLTDDELPPLVGGTDDESEAESSNRSLQKIVAADSDNASQAICRDASFKSKKKVTFKDENGSEKKSSGGEEKSAFDDHDNLLRKAVNKAKERTKKEIVEFYDSDEDESNERWVRQHREQLRIVKPSFDSATGLTFGKDSKQEREQQQDGGTDAVLSCPACMSLLTRDCQKHDLYHNQYRAIFVENCNVMTNEVLFLPQSGKNGRKARKNTAVKPNTVVDSTDVAKLPKEDLFHPVKCSICSTNVGVYDCEEIFHFFNVLTGYA